MLLDADGDDQILDCALNDAGDYLAVAGKFKGTMNFPSEPNITSAGGWDAYVALISTSTSPTSTTAPNGVAFGKTLGGTGDDVATGVDFGGTSIYVGGTFTGTADVDWKTTSTDNRTSAGNQDVFLSKFGGSGGTLKWTKRGVAPAATKPTTWWSTPARWAGCSEPMPRFPSRPAIRTMRSRSDSTT